MFSTLSAISGLAGFPNIPCGDGKIRFRPARLAAGTDADPAQERYDGPGPRAGCDLRLTGALEMSSNGVPNI